ncbi:MAG TPA: ANTAR domain-containing protein, partial [Catenuloplanes sp.]
MTTAEKPHQNDPGQTLVSLVEQLRAERDGLRQAMRTRSLIEQAKGILMARDGVTAEEAFTRLRQRSQRSNTRLVEVAAGLIADHVPPPVPEQTTATGAPPDAPEAPRGAQEQPPGTAAAAGNGQRPRVDAPATGRPARPSPATGRPARAPRAVAVTSRAATESVLHTQHLLLTGHLDAATGYDDVVAAVAATAAGWPPPASVVLALAEPDGALRIVAATGLSAEVRSQWHRVPPQVEVPLNTAARTGVPVWLTSPDEVRRTYPIMAAVTRRVLVSATLPLAGPDRPLGAVALSWEHPVSLDAARRSYLLAAAAAVAGAVVRLAPQA